MPQTSADAMQLLVLLQRDGPISVVDGDEPPFKNSVVKDALKLRYIHVTDGNFWSPITTYSITRKGLRHLGVDVPMSFGEIVMKWLS